MKTQDLLTALENTYHSHFPKSRIVAEYSTRLYRSIYIHAFLANDRSELSGGYWDNDMLNIRFQITSGIGSGEFSQDVTLDSDLDFIVLENEGKSYHINPPSSYLAFGSTVLSFRKASGQPEKIVQSFDKFCIQLKKSLQDDLMAGNIHKNYLSIVQDKLSWAAERR